jgi:hypothetical protein
MTNKEASFLLGAFRPAGTDATDPEFAEALAHAADDPALKAWFEDQRRFDAAVASRFQSVPAPGDLRSRILAGARVSRPAPWFTVRRLWAIAAMAMIFTGLGLFHSLWPRDDSEDWENRSLATLSGLVSGREKFDMQSPSVADLQQWLRGRGAPSAALPASIQRLASAGCKTFDWNGHSVSLICFHGPGGQMVHLAMVERAALSRPPPQGSPEYEAKDGWRLACWSQGDMAMMLATRAPEAQLHVLLGLDLGL